MSIFQTYRLNQFDKDRLRIALDNFIEFMDREGDDASEEEQVNSYCGEQLKALLCSDYPVNVTMTDKQYREFALNHGVDLSPWSCEKHDLGHLPLYRCSWENHPDKVVTYSWFSDDNGFDEEIREQVRALNSLFAEVSSHNITIKRIR